MINIVNFSNHLKLVLKSENYEIFTSKLNSKINIIPMKGVTINIYCHLMKIFNYKMNLHLKFYM